MTGTEAGEEEVGGRRVERSVVDARRLRRVVGVAWRAEGSADRRGERWCRRDGLAMREPSMRCVRSRLD